MADEAGTATPDSPLQESSDSEPLGDGGKKALDAERRARNSAEREAKQLKARLDEIEAATLSKEEKAHKLAAEAEARAAAAEASAMRYKVAAKEGITDEDAELFLTGADEATLLKQATRLGELIKQVTELSKKPAGLHVPAEGRNPGAPALNGDDLEQSLRRKLGIA